MNAYIIDTPDVQLLIGGSSRTNEGFYTTKPVLGSLGYMTYVYPRLPTTIDFEESQKGGF